MNTSPQNHFHDLGARLVLINSGKPPSDLNKAAGLIERLDSSDGDVFHREVCKLAAAAFAAGGEAHTTVGCLFEKLASVDTWHASYHKFTDPVYAALHRLAVNQSFYEKQATAAAAIPMVAEKVGMPAVVKMLLGLGVIGGVGGGSLGFLLSRDARQSSAENNTITEKTRAYKQLRRDITEDLAASGALEDEIPATPRYSI